MAFGIGAPGKSPEMHAGEVRMRTLAEYREQIRQIVAAGPGRHHAHVGQHERRADDRRAAVRQQPRHAGRPGQRHHRHLRRPRHGRYIAEPSRPFRTATLDHIQCGHLDCDAGRARAAAPTSACTASRSTTGWTTTWRRSKQYRQFRDEAERKGFRHFLEVFDPNAPDGLSAGAHAAVHQRLHRPHAGRRGAGRAGRSS